MNKKLLALLLAILMVAMSAVAMADANNTTEVVAETNIDITKKFDGVGKAAATFKFTVTADEGNNVNLPVSEATISFDLNDTEGTKTATLNLPSASDFHNVPGKYWYTITETEPETGIPTGVSYNTGSVKTYKLCVTVYNAAVTGTPEYKTTAAIHQTSVSGDKDTAAKFENEYDSAQLTVKKLLAGNGADLNDEFEFTVTFEPQDENHVLTSDIAYAANGTTKVTVTKAEGSYEYTIAGIGDSESVTFTNIPVGAKYTVEETLNENGKAVGSVTRNLYAPSTNGVVSGTIAATNADAVITNTYSTEIDTGVSTDTMPYILLMAFVAILAVAFVAKKRSVNE